MDGGRVGAGEWRVGTESRIEFEFEFEFDFDFEASRWSPGSGRFDRLPGRATLGTTDTEDAEERGVFVSEPGFG